MQKLKFFFNKYYLLFAIALPVLILLLISCNYINAISNNSIIQSHDILFHLNRIQGIADSIKGGSIPATIYPNALNKYGYASSLFYPELFLYIPALFVYLDVNIYIVYYLFILSIIIFMILVFIKFVKKFTNNKLHIVLITTLFVINPYFYQNIFYRGAIGEVLASLFFEILFLGVYNMLYENYSKPYLILLGLSGIVVSHTSSLVIACITLILTVLINAKKLLTNKTFYIKTSIIFIMFLFLMLSFYLPILEMLNADDYFIHYPWIFLSNNGIPLKDLFTYEHSLGPFIYICMILRIFIKKNENNQQTLKVIDLGIVFILIITLLISKIFPWFLFGKLLSTQVFQSIQFFWRLNILTIPIISLLEFFIILEFCKQKRKKLFIPLLLILLSITSIYNFVYLNTFGSSSSYYGNIGAGEWLPVNQVGINVLKQADYYNNNQNIYDSNQNRIPYLRSENSVRIKFNNDPNSDYYIIPLIYYNGYTAKLIDENGITHSLKLESNEYSQIKLINDKNKIGTIIIDYEGTKTQKNCDGFKLLSIMLYIYSIPYFIYIYKKDKHTPISSIK